MYAKFICFDKSTCKIHSAIRADFNQQLISGLMTDYDCHPRDGMCTTTFKLTEQAAGIEEPDSFQLFFV